MKNILSLFIILLLVSCSEQKLESNTFELLPSTQQFSINSGESTLDASALQWTFSAQENTLPIRYGVLKNLAEIEKKHGQQWDFCTCVLKNDSINKAFMKKLSDEAFDELSLRFDVIDAKCKAFLAQNPNQTPGDRAKHEKKVRDCLRAE